MGEVSTPRGDGVELVDMRLRSPFTAVVAGPTGSGKTALLMRLIELASSVADPPPVEIIYCYGAWQDAFASVTGARFHAGMIEAKSLPSDGLNRWLIVDDLMEELSGKGDTNDLFTKHSHHKNISVFYVVQNLFQKGGRTISINSHYFFLAKNPRDATTFTHLAKQMFPGKTAYACEAFADATSAPYSFALLDATQRTHDDRRIVGNFASPDRGMTVYSPK